MPPTRRLPFGPMTDAKGKRVGVAAEEEIAPKTGVIIDLIAALRGSVDESTKAVST